MTHVFGEAQLDGVAAVISFFRLRPEAYGLPPDENLLRGWSRRQSTSSVTPLDSFTAGTRPALDFLQRQPVLGGWFQNAEVSPQFPRPLRRHRGRSQSLRGFLPLVQLRASSRRNRPAHAKRYAPRPRCRAHQGARRRPHRSVCCSPRALSARHAKTTNRSHGGLDQQTRIISPSDRKFSTVNSCNDCLKLVDNFRAFGGMSRRRASQSMQPDAQGVTL